MNQIPVMVDEEVVALLGVSGDQLERCVLEILVLDLYRRHEISVMHGARLLGMEYMVFLRWSGERGVPYLDLTDDELQGEIRAARELSSDLSARQ